MKVVPIGVTDLRNAPEVLRSIAANLESGGYGTLRTAAFVILTDRGVSVHGMGPESGGPGEAAMLLAIGQRSLENMYCDGPVGRFEPAA